MARKEKKYHFIYKTTNKLSGKYYIGMHSTDNLDDGYLGSGNRIRLAIKKHGKENFTREIIEFCKTRKELYEKEEEVVNLDEVAKVDCMNLTVGGMANGFINEEHMAKCSKAGNDKKRELLKDPQYKSKVYKNCYNNLSKYIKSGKHNFKAFLGKKHTEETKKKMSESSKGKQKGEKNSQYDTCWITKNNLNKKIKKENIDQYIKEGWNKGRKYIAVMKAGDDASIVS